MTLRDHVLNALTAHVAVVGPDGTIRDVNAAWRRFAEENGAPELTGCGVGSNYFLACPADPLMSGAATGIKAVLDGQAAYYEVEYPCNAPDGRERWFMMQVSPFEADGERLAVVAHINITDRKFAERQHATESAERAEVERQLKEIAALSGLSQPTTRVTSQTYGSLLLKDGSPLYFQQMVGEYESLLHAAVEQRYYKINRDVSEDLRRIADHLGLIKARPRDVIDIHQAAVAQATSGLPVPKLQAYMEESRIMLVELLGDLVSVYRGLALGATMQPSLVHQRTRGLE